MIYVVIKNKGQEPTIKTFNTGVRFNGLGEIEWLYVAKNKSDADIALQEFSGDDNSQDSLYKPSQYEPKAKWYNWVGDPYWDAYCKAVWLFVMVPSLMFFGLIMWLIFTGRVS